MRSEFEKTKTYDLCKSWQIDFDEERQYYYSINPVIHADVTAINSAWRMFQEQKSKVDEARAKAQMCRDEKTHAIDRWSAVCKERDELQKRVDAATAKWISIISILTTTESNVPDVIYQQLDELHDALCGYELEQALKGGNHEAN